MSTVVVSRASTHAYTGMVRPSTAGITKEASCLSRQQHQPDSATNSPKRRLSRSPLHVEPITPVVLSPAIRRRLFKPVTDTKPAESTKVAEVDRKSLSWADHQGKPLRFTMRFRKEDEAWRCSQTHDGGPTVLARRSPPRSRARLPLRPSSPVSFCDALPRSSEELMAKLGSKGVQLESVVCRSPLTFATIRVSNLAFNKQVLVRVSGDNWATHNDIEAVYYQGSCDGRSDRFCATIPAPSYNGSRKLEFAICFRCSTDEYWDNNGGNNYHIALS